MNAATKLPTDVGPIHFVGIGGIGMSGIAEVLLTHGYTVQGSIFDPSIWGMCYAWITGNWD